ncbi:Crp/Fnr family transcriptional regulator [Desulfoplanes sp.]
MIDPTTIRHIPLFKDLSEEHIRALASCAHSRTYNSGDILWMRGETAGSFHVVLKGTVKIFRSSIEGKEQTMYLFGPGEPFCLCSGFAPEAVQPASAMALARAAVLSMSWDCLSKTTIEHPHLLLKIIQILSRRLKKAMDMVDALSLREIPSRLALFLIQTCDHECGTVTFQVSQREIAKIIGTTPETLSRVLKKFVDQGIVTTADRTVTVIDRERLVERAEG